MAGGCLQGVSPRGGDAARAVTNSLKERETVIERVSSSQGSGQKTEDAGLEYSANRGVSVSDQAADMVPRNLLMALPDLQYFAILNRAALYKGRIPVLTLGEKVAA